MHAVAEGSKVCDTKLDYGNASAWMREIPGRFGEAKQAALMHYLGITEHRLDPTQLHLWALPSKQDAALSAGVVRLLKTYAGALDQWMWVKNPTGGVRGLGIRVGGVSILFQPSAETNLEEMNAWLEKLHCTPEQAANSACAVKTDAVWQQLLSQQMAPEALWLSSTEATAQAEWNRVIDMAQQKGFTPAEVMALIERESQINILDKF